MVNYERSRLPGDLVRRKLKYGSAPQTPLGEPEFQRGLENALARKSSCGKKLMDDASGK